MLRKLLCASTILLIDITGCTNVENARDLNTDGLIAFVCKGETENSYNGNVCGDKSVWFEADNGFVAYISVYGINNLKEAKSIAKFVSDLKSKNKQKIPVNITIYSSKKENGRAPSKSKILEENI